jgi:hypothetical protein
VWLCDPAADVLLWDGVKKSIFVCGIPLVLFSVPNFTLKEAVRVICT